MVDSNWKPATTIPHSLPTPPDSQHPHQYPGPPQHHLYHPAAPRPFAHPASAAAGPPPPPSQVPPPPPPTQPNNHSLPPPRYGAPPFPYDQHHRAADDPVLVKHNGSPAQYRSGSEARLQHDSPDQKTEHHSGPRRSSASRHPVDNASPLNRTRTYPLETETSPRPLPNRDTHSAHRDMEYYPQPHATPLLEHMREQHHHMHHPGPPGHGPPPPPPHLDTAVGPSYGPHSQPQSAPPYGPQSYQYNSYDASLESSQKRKAVRASQACDNCRAKKAKCDENRPCGNCANQNIQCNFRDMPAPKQERSMMQLSEQVNGLGRRMDTIESLLHKIAGHVDTDFSSPSVDRTSRDRPFTPDGFANHNSSTDVSHTNHSLPYGRVDHRGDVPNGPSSDWNHSEANHSNYLPNGNYAMAQQDRLHGSRYANHTYDDDQQMSYEDSYESELSREVARRGQDAHEDMLSKDYLNGSVALAPRHLTAANHLIDWPSIAPFFASIAGRDYVKRGEYHHYLDLRQRARRPDPDSRALSTPAHSPLGPGEPDDSSTVSNTSDGRPAMAFVRQGGEGSKGFNPTPGGRNPRDQSLSIDSDTSFRLLQSYFKNIHILQPFLNRGRAKALVQDFVHSYYFEPTHTSSPMEHTSSQGSGTSAKRRKVTHSFGPQSKSPNLKVPIARSVENAVVLLILALGKICEHEGPLPPLVGESKIVPEGTPLAEGICCAPCKGFPGMVETWHMNANDESCSRTDQHGSDPYSQDIDRIPGLAYYVHAGQILGEIHGDNSLTQVHARLLAGLYLGQLVRVNESWQWIKAACDAWQMLFKQHDEMITRLSYDERAAFWACLMLESDILAEHDCIPSGISKWEDAFTANDDTLLKMDISNPAEEERYCFFVQGIIRSLMNRSHSALYVADEDKEKNSEWQKLSSEDYLNQLQKWRASLPEYLCWEEYETPASSINHARLRGKYYGARYVICRPYLRQILDPALKKVKSNADDNDLKAEHANKTNDISYARQCVDAARKSTLAFDSVPGMKKRLIVTNPFGTAQAQFSNVIVLSAAYCAEHLTGFINEHEMLFYIDRTREFLSYLAPLSPTMNTDIRILDNTKSIVLKAAERRRQRAGTNALNNSFHN